MKDKAKVYENIGVPIALLVLKESITLLNTYSHSEKTGIIVANSNSFSQPARAEQISTPSKNTKIY